MSGTLEVLPVWKSGPTLTAADRLHELALMAQCHPEKVERFVLVVQGAGGRYDHYQFGCDLMQEMGLFEIGKDIAHEESKR